MPNTTLGRFGGNSRIAAPTESLALRTRNSELGTSGSDRAAPLPLSHPAGNLVLTVGSPASSRWPTTIWPPA